MHLEELSLKTILTKIVAYFFVTLIILMIPPASFSFLLPCIGISTITVISLIFALRQSSPKLYLLYYLGSVLLIFLLGLRLMEISVGLSWILMVGLLPGFAIAIFLPFTSKGTSEFIYREQVTPQTKVGQKILILTLSSLPVLGVLGMTIGRTVFFTKGSLFPLLGGAAFYLTTISMVHSGFQMYTSGRFGDWMKSK